MKIQFKRDNPNKLKNESPYYTREELLEKINRVFKKPGYCFQVYITSDDVVATKVTISNTHIYIGEYTEWVSMKSNDFSKDFKLEDLISFIGAYLEKKIEEREAQLIATKNARQDLKAWFQDDD